MSDSPEQNSGVPNWPHIENRIWIYSRSEINITKNATITIEEMN